MILRTVREVIDHYWSLVEAGAPTPTLDVDLSESERFTGEAIPCAVFRGRLAASFIESDCRGCDFTSADLTGARFERCQLTSALFPRAGGFQVVECIENDMFGLVQDTTAFTESQQRASE